ncbi:MAG TPA: lipid-A-disaccharide synthase-related protein [bacterium]
MHSILIVSNGRGEDAVGAALAGLLRARAAVQAFPLVGLGEAYGVVPLLEPRRTLPSGGFALRAGPAAVVRDLRAGGLGLWRGQRAALRARAGRDRLVVVAGDVYALWMAAGTRAPIVFAATAKSESNERHRGLEVSLMRRHAMVVFTRDARTADALSRDGVNARFAGNPLVDVIPEAAGLLPLPPGAPVVTLLPGSRADAVHNMMALLRVARRIAEVEPAIFVAALPPSLEVAGVVRSAAAAGWTVDETFLRMPTAAVYMTRDFGGALRRAAVVLGLAGTANEQAAALGAPVVAFAPRGAIQYTKTFLRLQHRLLGEALVPAADWEEAAELTVRLLRDADERARRGAVGKDRMGPPGGVPAIAAELEQRLLRGADIR